MQNVHEVVMALDGVENGGAEAASWKAGL